MQPLLNGKKATASIIVTVVLASLVTGAVITGSVLVRNKLNSTDYISYQDAIDIASAIPEVASFITNNDIDSVSADRIDALWVVEFSTSCLNYTEDLYFWMNYAYVEIDAITGEVIYFEIYDPNNPNYTEAEIIAIANTIPEISNWIDTQGGDISVEAFYDGYEYWYVDYWSDAIRTYPHVIISDFDGSVVYVEIYDPLENANHTEAEILVIVEALQEVQAWKVEYPDYDFDIAFFDTVWFGDCSETLMTKTSDSTINCVNSTGGLWVVDYWAVYEEINCTADGWISVTVDDTTGEIINIFRDYKALMNETEALLIAEGITEVSDFLETMNYTTSIWFDNFARIWTVLFTNEDNAYEYAIVDVNDITESVITYHINDQTDPNMTQSEAIALALAQQEIIDFIAENPDYDVFAGFYDGYWYVDIYLDNRTLGEITIPPEGLTVGFIVQIDDATGVIVSIQEVFVIE